MSRIVTITLTCTFDLSSGELADEYRNYLDDYPDTRSQREWFAIDRMIGHENLVNLDPAHKLIYKEEDVV